MPLTRRRVLQTGLAGIAGVLAGGGGALPAVAAGGSRLQHTTASGTLTVHPVQHASFVMQTPNGVIYNDPVGGATPYEDKPRPDMILITHEHGDHYDVPTLEALTGEDTRLLVNPAVLDMLPGALRERAEGIGNGDGTRVLGYAVEAVPAYNTTESRLQYHPEGRDNGYLLEIDGLRVYIAGDTEVTPAMRQLENVDIAFLPMNLPYTMDVEQAAAGVADFAPTIVHPYHYRGSDIDRFERLVAEGDSGSQVMRGAWYD